MLFKLLGTLVFLHCANSAKILGVFHGILYSHQRLGTKILYELAARGHEVTLMAPAQFVPNEQIKNVKVIKLHSDIVKEKLPNIFDETKRGAINKIMFMEFMGLFLSEITLSQASIKDLLESNEQFDVVILEQFLNEAFRGFCYHFKAHCILLSTIGQSRWTNAVMGNPIFPSYVPENSLPYTTTMSFLQRCLNTYSYVFAELLFHFHTLPKHNELLQKYFAGAPHINELYHNISLMLLNAHVSINPPLPHVPNMIQIGGYHVDPPKALPKDLKEYLDDAKHGAIFFSMGSYIQTQTMPKEKLDAVIKVLSKLKQKVLWKIDGDNLNNLSANVKTAKWFPQQDILAHPNIVLFIGHGGLLSTIETIYHGKPTIGIPVYGDQEMNVAIAEQHGFAKALHFNDLTEETLENVIYEVIYNPKYTENAKRRSKIMHDEPMKPLDKAIFWIEYVIRHNGAQHLRTSALDLKWYQLISLDVVAFTLTVVFVILYCFSKFCKLILTSISKKFKKTPKAAVPKQGKKKKS